MVRNQSLLQRFVKMGKSAPAAKNPCITHLDDPRFYTSSEVDIVLIMQTADSFVNNDHKLNPFHSKSL